MRSLSTFLFLLSIALLPASAMADLRVVASLPSLAAIAAEVGGEHATVHSLATESEDPHYVDARPNFVVTLSRADLLVTNGLELEDAWLGVVTQQARNAAIQPGGRGRFVAADAVRLLDVPMGTLDRAMGDVHPGGNPHFLVDPRAVASIATALGDRMANLDASNAESYRANAARFAAEMTTLAEMYAAQFAALNQSQRRVVEYHASFSYLLDWLGLTRVASMEPRPGVPADPGHIAGLRRTMEEMGIQAIVQESFYPTSTSDSLARLVGAQVVIVPGGVNFAREQRYSAYIAYVVEELYVALTSP